MDDPENGGIPGGAIVTTTGYGARGVLPSPCVGWTAKTVVESEGNTVTGVTADGIGANGTEPSAATGNGANGTAATATGVTGYGANGTAASATGATGVVANGTGAIGAGTVAAAAATGAAAATVAALVVAGVAAVDSPLLMTTTFSPLGFSAPYKARPPTPASSALQMKFLESNIFIAC